MCSHFDGFQSRIAGARDAMRCEDESLNVGNLGSHESRSDKEREIATLRALALVALAFGEAAAHVFEDGLIVEVAVTDAQRPRLPIRVVEAETVPPLARSLGPAKEADHVTRGQDEAFLIFCDAARARSDSIYEHGILLKAARVDPTLRCSGACRTR